MPYGTVQADVIQSSVPGVSLGAGNATVFKNRIINGDMRIDQRNAGASTTPTVSGSYNLDRWQNAFSVASKYSVQQNAGSVTPPAGFNNYLGATSLSAYSVSASDYFIVQQPIEGFNTADLGFGTANAKTVTLSFQVYSSLTGTFGGAFGNGANNRSYPFSYTISSANTWTQISVTIAGDTSGTWVGATNGTGLIVRFGLGVGTTNSATAGSWQAGSYYSATGATSVVGTNGATFYITGVQLEVGSSATGFEYNDYGRQLIQCQRYFNPYFNGVPQNYSLPNGIYLNSVYSITTVPISPQMRIAAPTVTLVSGTLSTSGSSGAFASTATLASFANCIQISSAGTGASSWTPCFYSNSSATNLVITLSAEL
jgi:hypothetical protein